MSAKYMHRKAGKPPGPAGKGHKAPKESPPYSGSDASDDDGSDVEDAEDYRKGGYHPVQVGEKFKQGRYVVLKKLGWGHFSTVWLVLDTSNHSFAALKVQKSAPHYTDAARDEITLLSQIRDGDPSAERHCCRLLDSFDHLGPHGRHVCMVFEVLGDNLLSLIKAYDYHGVPLPVVRALTRQMLVALDYLHSQLQIIHTDFKPENVMLAETLQERRWEMVLQPAAQQQAAQQQAAGGGGGEGLSKNQKKKAKRKAKKAAAAGGSQEVSGSAATCSQQDDDAGQEEADSHVQDQAQGQAQGQGDGGANGAAAPHDQQAAQAQAAPETLVYESRVLRSMRDLLGARAVVVDFGNACWTHRHFTDDVQTRQYRCPEVILGAKYGTASDMWSLACVVFELVTGDFLFEPKRGASYERDEDHLALMAELLGRPPRRVWSVGKYAREYFNRSGELRHIKKLRFWDLEHVLLEKYHLPAHEARALSDFLLPMLRFDPSERATAAEALQHPWLSMTDDEGEQQQQQLLQREAGEARARRRGSELSGSPRGSPGGRPRGGKRSGSPRARSASEGGGRGDGKRTRSPSPSPHGHHAAAPQHQQPAAAAVAARLAAAART